MLEVFLAHHNRDCDIAFAELLDAVHDALVEDAEISFLYGDALAIDNLRTVSRVDVEELARFMHMLIDFREARFLRYEEVGISKCALEREMVYLAALYEDLIDIAVVFGDISGTLFEVSVLRSGMHAQHTVKFFLGHGSLLQYFNWWFIRNSVDTSQQARP